MFSICVVYFLVTLVAGENTQNCDKHGILIYEDLGCTPIYKDNSSCPVKYTCDRLHSKDGCYFRGKLYKDRQEVDTNLSFPVCQIGCYCLASETRDKFRCAALDCPEELGYPLTPNCTRKYSLDSCCAVGETCPPFETTCVVDGKEYKEGEFFEVPNPDACLQCVCQKGFTGKFVEPFCKRQLCGEQLRHDIDTNCAPFYTKLYNKHVHCCPNGWICGEQEEIIRGEATTRETCQFGVHKVNVGQYIERSNVSSYHGIIKKMRCDCEIPPFLKCVEV